MVFASAGQSGVTAWLSARRPSVRIRSEALSGPFSGRLPPCAMRKPSYLIFFVCSFSGIEESGYLVGLITRSTLVQIQFPQPGQPEVFRRPARVRRKCRRGNLPGAQVECSWRHARFPTWKTEFDSLYLHEVGGRGFKSLHQKRKRYAS